MIIDCHKVVQGPHSACQKHLINPIPVINVKLGYDFSMIDETSLTSNSGRQKAKASFGGIEGDVKKKASNMAKPPKKCSFH